MNGYIYQLLGLDEYFYRHDPSFYSASEFKYPSDYFESRGTKPPVIWFQVDESQVNTLRGSIVTCLSEGKPINTHHLYAYLCSVGQRMSNTSEREWVSFGQVICSANSSASVKDIFHVEKTENISMDDVIVGENITVDESDDIWIVLALFSIWVLGCLSLEEWLKRKLVNKMKKNVSGKHGITMEKLKEIFFSREMDKILLKLVAGFDMYLNYFNKDSMRIIRVATDQSRYKACLVIKDIIFVREKLGLTSNDQFYEWIIRTNDKLNKELERVNKPGQEIENAYSYFPYMMDLLEFNVSPYSTKINPSLHVLVNTIGAAFKLERCVNRKKPTIFVINSAMNAAALIIWAFDSDSRPGSDQLPASSAKGIDEWVSANVLPDFDDLHKHMGDKFRELYKHHTDPGSIVSFVKKWLFCEETQKYKNPAQAHKPSIPELI